MRTRGRHSTKTSGIYIEYFRPFAGKLVRLHPAEARDWMKGVAPILPPQLNWMAPTNNSSESGLLKSTCVDEIEWLDWSSKSSSLPASVYHFWSHPMDLFSQPHTKVFQYVNLLQLFLSVPQHTYKIHICTYSVNMKCYLCLISLVSKVKLTLQVVLAWKLRQNITADCYCAHCSVFFRILLKNKLYIHCNHPKSESWVTR